MKKLLLIWIFSGSLDGMCQDVHPINRVIEPIDKGFARTPVYWPDTLVTKQDTLRATLLVTYNGANMSIAHTKPGYVVRIGSHDKEFLDDRKKQIKAPVEVWKYKIKN